MFSQKLIQGLLLCATLIAGRAQVPFTGADYTQNFDTLAASGGIMVWTNNVTLPGWFLFDRTGVALPSYSTANANSAVYMSLGNGSASERALGSTALLGGGAAIGAASCYSAVALTNDTGHDIATFTITYTGEQWRAGTSTVANTTYLEYGFGTTYANVAAWTRPAAAEFHFTSPVATNGGVALVLDGNAAANSVANLGGDVTATWSAGATLWIRWVDINDAGNDHALAIDNVKVQEGAGAGPGDGGGDPPPLEGYTPFAVTQDSWTSAATLALQGTNPELRSAGGADPKEIVLKTDVTGVLGSVTSAKLRLFITGSQAGTKTQVYAANNDWNEGPLDWNTRPGRTILLAEVNNPDPAVTGSLDRYVDFDVTDYVSGTGTFSFIVQSDSSDDVVFDSREGATAPRLEVKYVTSTSPGEHNRLVTTVLGVAEGYKARYASADDVADIGIFDVTKQPYGADPTGQTDSTLAIQRAVNEARDARVVAYFPAGSYLVSDTLNMVQGRIGYQVLSSLGERWSNIEFANNLMGPVSGPRAKLVLAANAAGFTDATLPKKLLYFWSRGDNNANENQMNIGFNQTLRSLDIDLNGNAGAIGVDFATAQGSSVYDLTVYATGAFAGFNGTPGPGGSLTGVTVLGGKYGLYVADVPGYSAVQHAYSTHVNACNFFNQTDNSIVWTGLGTMLIVGTHIEGTGITNSANTVTAGALTVVDSVIRLGASAPAVVGSRSVHMDNVYLENATLVASLTSVAPVAANPGGWARVKEYAGGVLQRQSGVWDTYRASQNPPLSTHGLTVVPGFVDGVRYETPIATVEPSSAAQVPTNLQSRHAPLPAPSWNDSGVINVKTWSGLRATGDSVTDDLAALQAAVDAAAATGQKVFLPKGDYRVTGTLQVRANTTLFGVNKNISIIKSLNTAPAFSNASNPSPIVATPDDAEATTHLTELTLFQRMGDAGTYLINWRAGKGEVRNVNFDRRNQGASGTHMGFPLVRIEGNGGGRWYNFWNGSFANQTVGYRHMLVSGTVQPLGFYMFNPEADIDGIFNVEFIGVRNVTAYGTKLEGYHNTSIRVADSRNVRFFGFGGNAHPDAGEERFLIENSEDILFSMGFNQQAIPTADFTVDPNLYNQLREVRAGHPDFIIEGWEQFTLYRRGQPGASAPEIVVEASTAQVTSGQTVVLAPTIGGVGPLTYQWFRNGLPVSGANSATFSLAGATVANSGSYTLRVSNAFGSTTSEPIVLTVNPAPATVALAGLKQAYDGTPRVVTVTTSPAGLGVVVTYDGSATAPTGPGSYAVSVVITDPDHIGGTSGTLVVTTTALVRHAPVLNGGLDGSVQVLLGENVTLNGNAWISGHLLVPGTPNVRLNGHPFYGGAIDGTGGSSPSNYGVTLNGNAMLGRLVRRTDPLALPTVSAPPAPAGTRNVSIQSAGQSIGDPATLRNLTLNGNAGTYAVPAGTYGNFTANGANGFIFGEPGATVPAVYHLQSLQLNGTSQLLIVGPVRLVLAQGVALNGSVLSAGDPEWLTLEVASGGVTLNGNVTLEGSVLAPAGTVTLNGNTTLTGRVASDRLVINGSGLLEQVNFQP